MRIAATRDLGLLVVLRHQTCLSDGPPSVVAGSDETLRNGEQGQPRNQGVPGVWVDNRPIAPTTQACDGAFDWRDDRQPCRAGFFDRDGTLIVNYPYNGD